MNVLHDNKGILKIGGVFLAFGLLLVAGPALAAHGLDTSAGVSGLAELETDLPTIIGHLIRALLGFVGVILMILIIYAGFLWMTAAGNEERVGKAKKIIIGAIAGTIIVIGAYAITTFVVDIVSPSGPEGEVVGDEEFIETEDPLEEALTPEDLDTLLDEAGIGEAGDDSDLLD
ncbi:MAG: hypothetical protein U9Q03_01075 [Patescibacteria group bacterium]|nr:hypothetical protein [Patescibacteria group bacterium]